MKILVLSDSHRNINPMRNAVLLEKPDTIIHLGDHERDADELKREFPLIPLLAVAGNCDLMAPPERYKLVELQGKRFFLTHGHHYGVKMSIDALVNTALTAGADVALFGHTHVPMVNSVRGMLVMNPGSIGMGSRSYGLIDIENGAVKWELREC